MGQTQFDSMHQLMMLGNKRKDPRWMPDIVEFVTSPLYLNRPNLYPRQATLLKVIFLETQMMTQYDHDIIGEWAEGGFWLPDKPVINLDPEAEAVTKFQGDWGIVPDVMERIRILKEKKMRWFRVVLAVLGRRSGKGYIGAICGAYILWAMIMLDDPRTVHGIDRSKRLTAMVFAGKKMQARDNQWRDLVNVISEAPCFRPYIGISLSESLTIRSNLDLKGGKPWMETSMDLSTFEIVPKEATAQAGRGPASFMLFFDEWAHIVATSSGTDSADDVFEAAVPSLDQFHGDGFIYSGSSPYTMSGKFYGLVSQALQVDADTHAPVYYDSLVIQLESWNIYQDWERTLTSFPARPRCKKEIPVPDGKPREFKIFDRIDFKPLTQAVQAYDENMRRLERANPDRFRVERLSKWATAMDSYFPEEHVRRMFGPWKGNRLTMQINGPASINYVMHGDPGQTGSNFGWAVAHKEYVEDNPMPHVVFDLIKAWRPQDFPNAYSASDFPEGEMDYTAIELEIKDLIDAFLPVDVSLDPWNSIGILQRLGTHGRTNFKVPQVWQRNVTAALNWKTAETAKTALSLNIIHAPIHELLELECLFLKKMPGDKVDHPSTGPVTTKDVYDAWSICIDKLIGADVASYMGDQFSALHVSPGMPGPTTPEVNDAAVAFSRFTKERGQARKSRGEGTRLPTRNRRRG